MLPPGDGLCGSRLRTQHSQYVFVPLAMLEGSPVGVGQFITANLIPATLGNIAGGALFVGSLFSWIHLRRD